MNLLCTSMCMFLLSSLSEGHLDADSGQLSVSVLHSLDARPGSAFTARGSLTVRSLRNEGGVIYTPTGPLSEHELMRLKELARQDGLYRIKLLVKSTDGTQLELATFGKACRLVEAGLRDSLVLTVDSSGHILAVNQRLPAALRCHDNTTDLIDAQSSRSYTLESSAVLRQIELGPIPDTAAFIQKMEQEKLSKERGETKDNRSFLAKYWMYIIPVALLLMVSGGGEQGGR